MYVVSCWKLPHWAYLRRTWPTHWTFALRWGFMESFSVLLIGITLQAWTCIRSQGRDCWWLPLTGVERDPLTFAWLFSWKIDRIFEKLHAVLTAVAWCSVWPKTTSAQLWVVQKCWKQLTVSVTPCWTATPGQSCTSVSRTNTGMIITAR